MAGPTDIEWSDATWNPIAGCTMVSPGCTNCYAMRMAGRLQAMDMAKYRGTTRKSGGRTVWTGRVNFDYGSLGAPLAWHAPRRIFVNSMSDLFQEAVPERFVRAVWEVMAQAHWHTFQVLTKRPERMARILSRRGLRVLTNVWLGTSVENAAALKRLDHLRRTPSSIRFVSFEPLLGSVGSVDLRGIHWAIVGGESGPRSRSIEAAWVEEIRRACIAHDVAFFFKQWGGRNKKAAGRKLYGRTWDEFPAPLLAPRAGFRSSAGLHTVAVDRAS